MPDEEKVYEADIVGGRPASQVEAEELAAHEEPRELQDPEGTRPVQAVQPEAGEPVHEHQEPARPEDGSPAA